MACLAAREVFKRFCGSSLLLSSNCTGCCFPRFLSTSRKDDKPKKPTTHFLLYLQNIRKDLKQEYPEKSVAETARIAAVMYKDLPVNDKKKLFEESGRLLAEYKSKRLEWEYTLTEADKCEIVDERKTKKQKKQKKKLKNLQRENGMPRKYGTFSFGLFLADQLEGKHLQFMEPKERIEAMRQNMSECSELWRNMPESEKEIYTTRAQEQREMHEMEMSAWEAEMVKEGKLPLIRKSSLKKVQSEQRKADKEAGVVIPRKPRTSKKTVAKKTGIKSTKSVNGQKKSPVMKKEEKQSSGNDSGFFSSDTDSD